MDGLVIVELPLKFMKIAREAGNFVDTLPPL
jgi:hypothetical protein